MFQRTIEGLELRFHLAGINNQNFLLQDEQTGTYWQQITGLAVSGPLAGRRLQLVFADELTFALWKNEEPAGTVLNDVSSFAKDYASKDWDKRMAKVPTVISFSQLGLKPRSLMLGLHAYGASRAFPYEEVLKVKLLEDYIGSQPIILVVGADDGSIRVFRQRIPGVSSTPQFYRVTDKQLPATLLLDSTTGSGWNFQGCAVTGSLKGTCLERLEVIKDYWFDWRNYNPGTTVYGIRSKIK